MKNAEVEVEVDEEEEEVTPSTSPSTPPSPLPISVGPGNSKYYFSSSSPSPSPPFSPPTSADKLPLLPALIEDPNVHPPRSPATAAVASSAFSMSLDRSRDDGPSSTGSNCLQDLLQWFVTRCCSCLLTLNSPPKLHQS